MHPKMADIPSTQTTASVIAITDQCDWGHNRWGREIATALKIPGRWVNERCRLISTVEPFSCYSALGIDLFQNRDAVIGVFPEPPALGRA